MQRFFYALILFSICFVIGCGGSVTVKGTVKLADGTPIETGTVIFRNDKEQFSADIQPGGTFSPGRFKDGDGITPGIYQIYLTGVTRNAAPSDPYSAPAPTVQGSGSRSGALIHSKYEQPTSSGLSIDTSQTRTLNLVLDPAE